MRRLPILLASLTLAAASELHQAARTCDVTRFRRLLSEHPPLNDPDAAGITPLHAAVDAQQRACVGLLLNAGADRNTLDRQGRSPLQAAAQIADPLTRSAIEYMLKNFHRPGHGAKPGPMPWSLESSVNRRQTEATRMLLALGADPNTPGSTGTTPLADAALKGDLDTVRALLARGARFNAVGPAGSQPIHDAALAGSADVIAELVRHGADVNARTRLEAQTPLHFAAAMGRLEAIEALLALGADPALKDAHNLTPLQTALRANLPEAAAALTRSRPAK